MAIVLHEDSENPTTYCMCGLRRADENACGKKTLTHQTNARKTAEHKQAECKLYFLNQIRSSAYHAGGKLKKRRVVDAVFSLSVELQGYSV